MFKRRADIGSLILVHVGVGQRCRARAVNVESPARLPTMRTRNVPAGRWTKVQRMFERQADIVSPIIVHVGVGQRCRAIDVESPALLPTTSTRNVPAGRWMKRCRAIDVESPAMLPTMSTRNVPAGRWMKVPKEGSKGEHTAPA
eukprot:scaffold18430_cov61-Phaeocystis_antarctica.AAC.2